MSRFNSMIITRNRKISKSPGANNFILQPVKRVTLTGCTMTKKVERRMVELVFQLIGWDGDSR